MDWCKKNHKNCGQILEIDEMVSFLEALPKGSKISSLYIFGISGTRRMGKHTEINSSLDKLDKFSLF